MTPPPTTTTGCACCACCACSSHLFASGQFPFILPEMPPGCNRGKARDTGDSQHCHERIEKRSRVEKRILFRTFSNLRFRIYLKECDLMVYWTQRQAL